MIRSQRVPPIRVLRGSGVFHSPARWRWMSERRDHFNLWIALSGTGTMQVGRDVLPIHPGRAFLLAPSMRVQAEGDASAVMRNAALHFMPPARHRLHFQRMSGKPADMVRSSLAGELVDWISELLQVAPAHPDVHFLGRSLVRLFVADLARPPVDPRDRIIRSHAAAIRSNPGRVWSIPALAAEVRLSPSQYHRCFRRIAGFSPHELVVRTRIETARRLLREGTLGVEEIGRALGYRDTAFFSRQFKAKTGRPPGRYRANRELTQMKRHRAVGVRWMENHLLPQ